MKSARSTIFLAIIVSAPACTAVNTVNRTQKLYVHTNPDDAAIYALEGTERRLLGRGNATIDAVYKERVVEFDSSCWGIAIGSGVAMIGGGSLAVFGRSDPARAAGGVTLAAGLITLAASLGACIAGEHASGTTAPLPATISLAASNPGYIDRTVQLSVPLPTRNIDVQLEPAPIHIETAAAGDGGAPVSAKAIVAVFDLEDPGRLLEAPDRAQLTEYFVAELASTGRFRVLPRDVLRRKLLRDKARSFEACFDASCQIELGKALAAQESVSTRVIALDDSCVLTALRYDLKTETAIGGTSVGTQCDAGALLHGLTALSRELAKR